MKRFLPYFLVLMGIILLSIPTFAQPKVIPSVGFNLSSINLDLLEGNTTPKTGYQVGACVRLGNSGFLQTGLFFHQYSNQISGSDTLTQQFFDDEVTFQGILVPIHMGFHIYNMDILKIRLMAGINLDFPTDLKPNDFNFSVDDLNGTNVELAVGFGFDIYRFVIDANFGFAMNDLFSNDALNSTKNLYMLNVGYLIGKMY